MMKDMIMKMILSEYYTLISRIKNGYIKNAKETLIKNMISILVTISNIILYDDNNDNPLNDEGNDYEDDIVNSEYYTLISRIISGYIKNAKKALLNYKECDFNFGNSEKY